MTAESQLLKKQNEELKKTNEAKVKKMTEQNLLIDEMNKQSSE